MIHLYSPNFHVSILVDKAVESKTAFSSQNACLPFYACIVNDGNGRLHYHSLFNNCKAVGLPVMS